MKELKQELYNLCKCHIAEQISDIETAIRDRRDAMHNETKSSMGDKYETTREMLQQDINMNLERLNKIKADAAVLARIDAVSGSAVVVPGSIVFTDSGSFYLSVSAGKLIVNGKHYYAVSPGSPIGVQLMGKHAGDSFVLNGRTYKIEEVQ